MRIPASLSAALLAVILSAAVPARPAGVESSPQQATPAGQQPPAQDPPQDPERSQQPPIRTAIDFVRVDVIVTDRNGQPVLDLGPDDFTITEDGKPQNVESFSVIRIDEAAQADAPPPIEIRSAYDEEREAARPDVRLFVILLDDYHVRRGNDMAVRKPLIDFIQNQLAPVDLVAIMYPLTPVKGLSFTRNRESLISAIENFEGRRFNYEPRNQFEEQYAYYPAATVEKIRNDVTMSALKGAAVRLGNLREGRKSIIFVSEGLTSTLPPQLNDPIAAMPGVGNPSRRLPNVEAGERAEFFDSTTLLSDLREVFEIANRTNTSIYPVDPRGLGVFEYDINQGIGLQQDRRHLDSSLDTLRVIADNTDGRAIINRNDLAAGMKQIIRDSSGYYLLGYTSPLPPDGKFHEIRVRVNRRGLDVRARKGYWAYTAEDAARATAPPKPEAPAAITSALNSIAEPPRGRAARFWIGTSRGDNGQTKVTFVWEPVPAGPGERRAAADGAARVMLTATALDGRPLFRGRVPDDDNPSSDGTGSTGTDSTAIAAGASATFDAPPGQVLLRMSVEGANAQVVDSATRELTIPDFTLVEVSFATPRVYRARTPREIQTIKRGSGAPTADRTFSRRDRLFIQADSYAPGGSTPDITARLLNRNGESMADIPVTTGASGSAEIDFALANLPVGDYLIELTASTPSGSSQELIAFKIAS